MTKTTRKPFSVPQRLLIGAILAVPPLATCWYLLKSGVYGLTLFLLLPIVAGAIASWIMDAKTARECMWAGALGAVLSTFLLLATGMEGLICIFMSWPLAIPLGMFGGMAMFWHQRYSAPKSARFMMMILPLGTMGFDTTAEPPVYEVKTSIEIAATPDQVWKHVVSFSDIAEPTEWFFNTGLAYPKRTRIVGSGPGALRYCDLSTGPVVETVEVWDEPRLLRFHVTKSPPPMRELGLYGDIYPKHLEGYFQSKQGQFKLTALSGGRTLVEGTSWYQHGLWPAQYWRLWSDEIVHRIHVRVLTHVKALAEAER